MRTPFTIEQFGGLNLTADPLEVGAAGARDIKNVRLDAPGKLLTRGGFDTLNSTTLASVVGFVGVPMTDGSTRYVSFSTSGQTVRVYDAGLTTHSDQTPISGTFTGGVVVTEGAARLARSDAEILVVPPGFVSGTSVGTPRARLLGLTGVSGRYVAAYARIGAAPLRYRVHFSAPGDSETWGSTDFVDLWEDDGGSIRGIATFRNLVFVFKDRRFAVFYGESTDADGGAIFNYHGVDVGIGCAYEHGAVTGPDGVYFIAVDGGIYRTVGDAPTLISGPIQPVFDGGTDGDWNGPTSIVSPKLYATQDRLYFINDAKVFVYHYRTGTWTLDVYTPGVQFLAQTASRKARSVYFIDGTGKLCEAGDTFTDDDGTAIAWSYKSGRYTPADPGRVAVIPETSIVGSGIVNLRLDTDLYTNQNGTVTLGTAPATAEGWPANVDQEGTWMQYTLSGTGAASVSRINHDVSFVRPAGVR
jgi:hypothetical protein